jgi:hypothetical protein
LINPIFEHIWKFIRCDESPSDFERWVCSEVELENEFGKTFYTELISANYSNHDEITYLKTKLEHFTVKYETKCSCHKIRDIDVIGMGSVEEEFMATFEQKKVREKPYWWLYVSQCNICQTNWLIAQEEVHNDDYLLKRLSVTVFLNIINENHWPGDFHSYAELLKLSKRFGHSVRYDNPMNSSSLIWTIATLIKENPSISIEELSELINVDEELTKELAKKAVETENIKINFD